MFMGTIGERIWEQCPRKLNTKGKIAYGVYVWGQKVNGYGGRLKVLKSKRLRIMAYVQTFP